MVVPGLNMQHSCFRARSIISGKAAAGAAGLQLLHCRTRTKEACEAF